MPWTEPMRLTAVSQFQSVSTIASRGPPMPAPALLQTMCTLPKAANASSAAFITETGSETSQATARAYAPQSVSSRRAASSGSSSMSASITFAPFEARARAKARPMPLAAPVTKAVFPSKLSIISLLLSVLAFSIWFIGFRWTTTIRRP